MTRLSFMMRVETAPRALGGRRDGVYLSGGLVRCGFCVFTAVFLVFLGDGVWVFGIWVAIYMSREDIYIVAAILCSAGG